jgi:hypothetical protein
MSHEYTVFTGCSYVEGVGLSNTSKNENLWVNLFFNSNDILSKTKLLNFGRGGATNFEIFQRSVDAMSNYNIRHLFVSWTEIYRYKFSCGLEKYSTDVYWGLNSPTADIGINPDIVFTKEYLANIKNRFFALHHDHYQILQILRFTHSLSQLAKKIGIKIYFINCLLPWDKNYFQPIASPTRLPSDTTQYTQKLLNSDTRNDTDFFDIYDQIHIEYQKSQGLGECNWLNLDQSYRQNFYIDTGNDNLHPGVDSNKKFAKYLINCFEQNYNTI